MSYQERRTMVNLLSAIPVLLFYGAYILAKQQTGKIDMAHDLVFWGWTFLLVIGVGIVFTILVQIVFHIVNTILTRKEEDPSFEDELDKLIALKSDRFSFIVVGIGFVLAMVTLVMKLPPAVMMNVLFLSFYTGSLIGEGAKIYFYRRGL